MRYFLFATALVVFMLSCQKRQGTPNGLGRQDKCNAFNPALIARWMPYSLNTTYNYIDSNGAKYSLTVDSLFSSEEYYATSGSCTIEGSVYALADTVGSMDINMSVAYYQHQQDPLSPHFTISWLDAEVGFNKFYANSDTLHAETLRKDLVIIKDKMSLGKEYNKVHEVIVNTAKLQKLYIAQGSGVVAFVTADSTLYWLDN